MGSDHEHRKTRGSMVRPQGVGSASREFAPEGGARVEREYPMADNRADVALTTQRDEMIGSESVRIARHCLVLAMALSVSCGCGRGRSATPSGSVPHAVAAAGGAVSIPEGSSFAPAPSTRPDQVP